MEVGSIEFALISISHGEPSTEGIKQHLERRAMRSKDKTLWPPISVVEGLPFEE